MNKQFVAAMTSVAMLASSCVSTQKYDTRGIASSQPAPAPAVTGKVADIAAQGVEQVDGPAQQEILALRKGRNFDFSNRQFRARKFEDSDVKKIASAYDVKLTAGQVMVDNDLSFERKLRVIESAKSELRMVYFIYASDDSSSKLNAALLAKAKSGVKVKLLVDFITNYKNLDLFIALNKLSGGNIEPYFYNFPNQQVFADAMYMSLPCSKVNPGAKAEDDTCYQEKMAKIKAMGSPAQLRENPPAMAKILLSGIYGKSATALKVAVGMGAQINPADYKGGNTPKPSEDELESLLDLAVIFKEAFVDNSIIAKIKLSIAMSMYGEKINPILNELSGRFPVRSLGEYGSGKGNSHGDVWDHFTDYTHHKLVLADKEQFVLGGRNVEDSYHMKHRVGSEGKYIFMDTDFWGQTAAGGAVNMAKAFDAIVKSPMVANLATTKSYLSYDFIANLAPKGATGPGATEMAIGTCAQQGAGEKLGDCILSSISKMPGYKNEDARIADVMKNMQASAANYQAKYKLSPENAFSTLSPRDLETASFHYLENTVMKDGKRVPGSKIGFEADYNKNIQVAWYRGLENVCRVSRDEKRDMRVVFNTAYLLMPTGMVHRIAQMMNNDFGDCSRVTLTFITNSPYTTDLAPINVLARYQLGALFDHYNSLQQYKETFEAPVTLEGSGDDARYVPATSSTPADKIVKFKYKQFWPKLQYFEYLPTEIDDLVSNYVSKGKKPNSLHTKTSMLGDDLIVGSANADVRSYFMDTNNAMMIRNAHELNGQYLKFIDGLISSGKIVDRMGHFQGRSFAQLRAENEEFLVKFAQRWRQEGRLDKGYAKKILEYIDAGGQKIYTTTKDLLTYRNKFENANAGDVVQGESYKFNEQLNKDANAMDDLFKLF